jgi:MFS family permease
VRWEVALTLGLGLYAVVVVTAIYVTRDSPERRQNVILAAVFTPVALAILLGIVIAGWIVLLGRDSS